MALCLGAALPVSAWAEVVVPGSLVPGRQGEARKEPLLPQSTPEAAPPLVVSPMAPDKAAALMVTLSAVTIEGASALPASSFDDLWKPLVGQTISVARLFDVAAEITRRYAQEGYALGFAVLPEQKIDKDGRVRIHVVEGYVDKIVYTGDAPYSLLDKASEQAPQGQLVEEMASRILASHPLRTQDIEQYTLLLNRLAGVKATTRFTPSQEMAVASTLTVDIVRKRVDAEAFADNRQSRNMKRWEIGGSVSLNGFMYGGDRLKLDTVCSKEGCDDASDLAAQWSSLIGTQGTMLTASFAVNRSRPIDGDMSLLAFQGLGRTFSLSVDTPVVLTRQERVYVGAGFNASDSRTKTFAGPLTQDKVRTFDVHASYDVADALQGSTILMPRLVKGLPFLEATSPDDPLRSRAFGSARFLNATLHAARVQPLAVLDPSFDAFSLYFGLDGQAALSHALLSTSQCSYGGAAIGRGYEGGVISGDHCVQGIAELRYDWQTYDIPFQAYMFGDAGRAWIKGALLEDEASGTRASSAGLGVRILEDNAFSGDIQLAFPLRPTYAETRSSAPRLFVSFKTKY